MLPLLLFSPFSIFLIRTLMLFLIETFRENKDDQTDQWKYEHRFRESESTFPLEERRLKAI